MANHQQNQSAAEAPVNLSAAQLAEIIREAVTAARQPLVDEAKEAQVARNKKRMQDQLAESTASIKAGQDSCSHLREDNTARIAWADYYHAARKLYVREGYCQACNKHFGPGVEGYAHWLSVPTGKQGIVR